MVEGERCGKGGRVKTRGWDWWVGVGEGTVGKDRRWKREGDAGRGLCGQGCGEGTVWTGM